MTEPNFYTVHVEFLSYGREGGVTDTHYNTLAVLAYSRSEAIDGALHRGTHRECGFSKVEVPKRTAHAVLCAPSTPTEIVMYDDMKTHVRKPISVYGLRSSYDKG